MANDKRGIELLQELTAAEASLSSPALVLTHQTSS